MGFRFGDIVTFPAHLEEPFQCPTGKRRFATKAEAQAALKRTNRLSGHRNRRV